MNKLEQYIKYLFSIVYFTAKKIVYGNNIKVSLKNIIGRYSSIRIRRNGSLKIGKRLYTRNNFNLLIEGGKCQIGDNCFFNHNCSITCLDKIIIGDGCTFGNNIVIVDHDHNYKNNSSDKFLKSPVYIGKGSWIGANVTILRGAYIGQNCIIAAGAIVKHRIEDNTVYIPGK